MTGKDLKELSKIIIRLEAWQNRAKNIPYPELVAKAKDALMQVYDIAEEQEEIRHQ